MSEKIVFGDREAIIRISRAVGRVPNPAADAPISIHRDETLLGGVIYSDFSGESVCVHVAGFEPNWLSRLFLYVAFDYPFNQMGVRRVFSQMREDNELALGFNRKLGFEPVAYIPGVYPTDVAMIITRMEREDCRWLKLAAYYQREYPNG